MFNFLQFSSCKKIHHPHNTVNPLCSTKPVRLTTSLNSWDKVSWLFVCRFPHCPDTGGGAPPLSVSNTFRSDAFLLLVDNLGILIEGNLLLCLSRLPLGVPNSATTSTSRSKSTKHFSGVVAHIKHFSGAVAREKYHFCE